MGGYLLTKDSAPNKLQSSSVYSDSMPAPERPTITAQEDTVLTPVGEDLAPGTALVKATVVSEGNDGEKNGSLRIRADEVLGSNPSTPPVAAHQELEIEVERFLKRNPADKKLMQEGQTITIVISSEEGMSVGGSQGKKRWSLVELKSP